MRLNTLSIALNAKMKSAHIKRRLKKPVLSAALFTWAKNTIKTAISIIKAYAVIVGLR